MTVEPIGRRYGLREETKDLQKGREGEGEEQAANERQAGGEVGRPWTLTNRPPYCRLLDATTRRVWSPPEHRGRPQRKSQR